MVVLDRIPPRLAMAALCGSTAFQHRTFVTSFGETRRQDTHTALLDNSERLLVIWFMAVSVNVGAPRPEMS